MRTEALPAPKCLSSARRNEVTMKTLDPRAPLVLDTRSLQRRPGSMQEITRSVPAPAGLGTEVIAIPEGSSMDLDLRLESVMEGVLLSGSVRARAEGACVRCLEQVTQDIDAPLQELFAYADRAAHHHEVGADADEDQRVLEGDLLDLEDTIRDAVVPALPFQPVCSPDCPGLCSECGAALADDPEHAHENIDPRWASLQQLASSNGKSTSSTDDEEKRN